MDAAEVDSLLEEFSVAGAAGSSAACLLGLSVADAEHLPQHVVADPDVDELLSEFGTVHAGAVDDVDHDIDDLLDEFEGDAADRGLPRPRAMDAICAREVCKLPRPGARRGPKGLFEGEMWRGKQHAALLRAGKAAKRARREMETIKDEQKPVQNTWNETRLRRGDHIGDITSVPLAMPGNSTGQASNVNRYDTVAIMKDAWRQVGAGGKVDTKGIEGNRHHLAILATVSSAADIEQTKWVEGRVAQLKESRLPFALFRYYDSTPGSFAFGKLQSALYPLARYPWWDGTKWKSCTLDEYQKVNPRCKRLWRGVLEIMDQSVECRYVDKDQCVEGFKVLVQPKVLSDGSASCIYSATESAVPALSAASVSEMCQNGQYAFVSEQPDRCAANVRKQSQTYEDFSGVPTAFYVPGRCAAHQICRCVKQAESQSVGDVHACVVSLSHTRHAHELQRALKVLLQNEPPIIICGEPPARLTARNIDIAKRTWFRQEEFIQSDEDDPSPWDNLDPGHPVKKLLQWWNGDWSLPHFQHYRCGGDAAMSEAEVAENMYAAAVDAGVLCGNLKEPSLDDWGSAEAASGNLAGGILMHRVLPRTFKLALPSWSSMIPAADADEDSTRSGADAMRKRIQKKSWRAQCVFEQPERFCKLLALCWVTTPIERARSEVIAFDNMGKTLMDRFLFRNNKIITCLLPPPAKQITKTKDSAFNDNMNPFFKCARGLATFLKDGTNGAMASLFELVSPNLHDRLRRECQRIELELASQADWRFKEYSNFPHRWVQNIHAAASDLDRERNYDLFFNIMRDCCRTGVCNDKIFKHFGGDLAAMKGECDFWSSLRAWALGFRWTNVNMERLFACYRRWVPGDSADVERLISTGFLGEWLQQHEGDDPRVITRRQLLESGVPIQAKIKRRRRCAGEAPKRAQSVFSVWYNGESAARKAAEGQQSKALQTAWTAAKVEEWGKMDPSERYLYRCKAQQQFYQGQDEAIEKQEQEIVKRPHAIQTVVDAVGSSSSPYPASAFDPHSRIF